MKRLLVFVAVLLCVAAPAFAHVKVSPAEVTRGSTATFTFSVPNEEDAAKTVKVEIFMPEDATFLFVSGTVSGWKATTAGKSVSWSGGAISGDDAVEFPITAREIQGPDTLVFKVLQTYDNGEVVRWIDVQTGSEEPPHPAPVVKLTGASPTTSEVATTSPTTKAPRADEDDDSNSPVLLIVVSTFFAAVGIGIGIGVLQRRRR